MCENASGHDVFSRRTGDIPRFDEMVRAGRYSFIRLTDFRLRIGKKGHPGGVKSVRFY